MSFQKRESKEIKARAAVEEKKKKKQTERFVIEEIIGRAPTKAGLVYLVKWENYPVADATWTHQQFFLADLGVEQGEFLLNQFDKKWPSKMGGVTIIPTSRAAFYNEAMENEAIENAVEQYYEKYPKTRY